MIASNIIKTNRLEVNYLSSGNKEKDIVILLHGNVSSSAFFIPLMKALGDDYHYIAPDMRGYGNSETKEVDATRGVKDFSDDLKSFLDVVNTANKKVHLHGWSLGGGVVMQYVMDYPANVTSVSLESPMSPFGFGATKNKGLVMEACSSNFAGSGGGTVNPAFIDCLRTHDGKYPSAQPEASRCNPQSHARATMNSVYFKMIDGKTLLQRGVIDAATEDIYTEAMFSTQLGDGNYPGTSVTTTNWPGMAPGDRGINNAISPKYCNLSGLATCGARIPVLWIRGADDQIVSDNAFLDLNTLGKLGYMPGWPGEETNPSQPMVTQMRTVLESYQENGGTYQEVVFGDCGHSPHAEWEQKFVKVFKDFVQL